MKGQVSVMLVEDEFLIAAMVNDVLVDSGCDVIMLHSGAEAWRVLARVGPPCMLVTDIDAGDGPDGWEIARYARERRPNVGVVYTTGAAAGDWAFHGVPGSLLVPKPFEPAQIVSAVSHLLGESGKIYDRRA